MLVLFVTALTLSIVSALFVRYVVPQFFTNLLSVSVKDSFWSVLSPTILALWVVLMLLYIVTDCVLYRAILVDVQKQSASLTATICLVGRRTRFAHIDPRLCGHTGCGGPFFYDGSCVAFA